MQTESEKYTIKANNCDCHPETCNHWNYYIYDSNGNKLFGKDEYKQLEEFLNNLGKENAN